MPMFRTRNAQIGGGILAATVIFGAGYLWLYWTAPSHVTARVTPQTIISDTTMTSRPLTAAAVDDAQAARGAPPLSAPKAADTPDIMASPNSPSFDEVRREVDGVTVIAGRASPGSNVRVMSNGAEIATATADSAGKFATLAILPPDGTGQVLSLAAQLDATTTVSDEEIILAPLTPSMPAAAAIENSVVAGLPGEITAPSSPTVPDKVTENAPSDAAPSVSQPSTLGPVRAPQTPDAPEVPATMTAATTVPSAAPETPVAEAPPRVAVLKSTPDGVELLPGSAPEVTDRIALDTISYSETGEVRLGGRAQSLGKSVRVYLNNSPVVALAVDPEGRWRGDLKDIDTGIYTLRVDELDGAGKVISRVETPFKRESAATLERASASHNGPISAITVQEGATLWAIARERYGDPFLYVRVFEANRDSIRDPDLIYPGQVFDLPD
jgi:nucleoid-associated protein YgaU